MSYRKLVHQFSSACRKKDLLWRYVFNLRSSIDYGMDSSNPMTPTERQILDELKVNGVAAITIDQLLSDQSGFRELQSAVEKLLDEKKPEIAEMRSAADSDTEIGRKTFNLETLGSEVQFAPDNVFARFALNESFSKIANGYFGMRTKLRYYNVWYTTATSGASRESQLWHFDREDNYILKMFLYLDDVDEGAGPFTYAPGTHRRGKYRSIRPEFIMEGNVRRTTDEQMSKVYPREKWKVGTGKKGTIIFADTRGYHKGGEARTKDRLMFTCMYTSPASQSKDLIRFPKDFSLTGLSAEQIKALRIPRQ